MINYYAELVKFVGYKPQIEDSKEQNHTQEWADRKNPLRI